MLAFQVLSGRGLRGVFPSVRQSTLQLLASSAREKASLAETLRGGRGGGRGAGWARFQLTLCFPKQAVGGC